MVCMIETDVYDESDKFSDLYFYKIQNTYSHFYCKYDRKMIYYLYEE